MKDVTFKPKINKKDNTQSSGNIYEKLYNTKPQQTPKDNSKKEEFTFRPQINKNHRPSSSSKAVSRDIDKKPVYERLITKENQIKEKKNKKKEELEKKELEQCTFKPNITPYSNKDHVQIWKRKESMKDEYEKREQEKRNKELKECTFKPKISVLLIIFLGSSTKYRTTSWFI